MKEVMPPVDMSECDEDGNPRCNQTGSEDYGSQIDEPQLDVTEYQGQPSSDAKPTLPIDVGAPGPFVDLEEGLKNLADAATEHAHSRKLQGLLKSGKAHRPHDVESKSDKLSWQGNESLRRAFGIDAMIAAGMTEWDAYDMFVQLKHQFRKDYADPSNPNAAKHRRELNKHLEKLKKRVSHEAGKVAIGWHIDELEL